MADFQAGSNVTISSKNAYATFKADLYSFEPIAAQISSERFRNIGKSAFIVNAFQFEASGKKATFYVYGDTKEQCDMNVSKLIAACKSCIIKLPNDDSFEYVCELTDFNHEYIGIDFYQKVELTFAAIKRKALVTVTQESGGGTFTNNGTLESGLKIVASSTSAKTNVTIKDQGGRTFKIKNMAANVSYTIDGITGKVLRSSLNDFGNIELVDFPKVVAGSNKITAPSGVKLVLSYYPVFVS